MVKVIKIGGKLIENEAVLDGLCDKLMDFYPDCVLVHGGGSLAGQLSALSLIHISEPTRP